MPATGANRPPQGTCVRVLVPREPLVIIIITSIIIFIIIIIIIIDIIVIVIFPQPTPQ